MTRAATTLRSMSKTPAPTLVVEIQQMLEAVRASFSSVIASAAMVNGGRSIRRATELQRTLDIPTTLAWQVFRVANAKELLAEAENVPGSKAVRRFIRAAEEKGLAGPVLAELLNAVADFESLVRTHAGDRKTFNSMVAGLAGEEDEESDLHHRRTSFQANSHIWGTQAAAKLITLIVHPSRSDSELMDVLTVVGTIDLCRLRGESPYELSSSAIADGSPLRSCDRIVALGHPLASNDITTLGSTLLTEFGTQPLPKINNYVDADGRLVVELDPEELGRQHAVTAFVAELYPNVGRRYRTDDEFQFSTTGDIRAPVARWIVDIVIADGTFGSSPPQIEAFMVMNPTRGKCIMFADVMDRYKRQIIERPQMMLLGSGANALQSPDVDNYPAMFKHLCGQLQWNPDVFSVYRSQVDYPVISSSIVAGFQLPDPPKGQAEQSVHV